MRVDGPGDLRLILGGCEMVFSGEEAGWQVWFEWDANGRDTDALVSQVIPGYTENVKTAISVPDDTFEQATQQAKELGISRSEFFSRAARRYLDELSAQSLTRQINDALRTSGADDSSQAAAAAGRRRLADEAGW